MVTRRNNTVLRYQTLSIAATLHCFSSTKTTFNKNINHHNKYSITGSVTEIWRKQTHGNHRYFQILTLRSWEKNCVLGLVMITF